jgi:hypothetical protein
MMNNREFVTVVVFVVLLIVGAIMLVSASPSQPDPTRIHHSPSECDAPQKMNAEVSF